MPAVTPQPKTLVTYEPNGTGIYNITFEYELESDVRVGLYNTSDKKFNRVEQDDAYNPWTFTNATTITFTNGDPGLAVMIYRATDINQMIAEFYTGSAIRAQDLNANFEQLLFSDQELTDQIFEISQIVSSSTPINILPGTYPDDIPDVGDLEPGDSLLDESGNVWIWNGDIWVNGGPGGGTNGKGWTGGSYDSATGIVTFTSDDGLGFTTTDLRGEQGEDGEDGSAATVSVGSTTTLAPGSSATVANSGTTLNAVLDFGIPQGLQGEDGEDGRGWTSGEYNSATGVITFNSSDGLGFATGDVRGADGVDGDDGNPGVDGAGWTGGSYDSATGIVTFNSDDGLTFSTTDVRGADGTDGDPGVNGTGFTGGSYNSGTGIVTFTSDDGLGFSTTDIRGAAASVSVGTTTTGSPGSSASVTNSGTSSAATFNFTIPRGDQGLPGDSQWQRVGTNLEPVTSNDGVVIGTNQDYA